MKKIIMILTLTLIVVSCSKKDTSTTLNNPKEVDTSTLSNQKEIKKDVKKELDPKVTEMRKAKCKVAIENMVSYTVPASEKDAKDALDIEFKKAMQAELNKRLKDCVKEYNEVIVDCLGKASSKEDVMKCIKKDNPKASKTQKNK